MLFSLVAVPLFGNFVPSRLSFLLSMRYYAGNWAYNVWLFKKDSNYREKLAKLKRELMYTTLDVTDPKLAAFRDGLINQISERSSAGGKGISTVRAVPREKLQPSWRRRR